MTVLAPAHTGMQYASSCRLLERVYLWTSLSCRWRSQCFGCYQLPCFGRILHNGVTRAARACARAFFSPIVGRNQFFPCEALYWLCSPFAWVEIHHGDGAIMACVARNTRALQWRWVVRVLCLSLMTCMTRARALGCVVEHGSSLSRSRNAFVFACAYAPHIPGHDADLIRIDLTQIKPAFVGTGKYCHLMFLMIVLYKYILIVAKLNILGAFYLTFIIL